MEALRVCRECKVQAFTREDLENFKVNSSCKYNREHLCKTCYNSKERVTAKQRREDNPEWARARSVKYNILKQGIDISLEDYLTLMDSTTTCDICHKVIDKKNKHCDHDHSNGKVRGVLCNKCNMALGLIDDNTSVLEGMIEYLNKSL